MEIKKQIAIAGKHCRKRAYAWQVQEYGGSLRRTFHNDLMYKLLNQFINCQVKDYYREDQFLSLLAQSKPVTALPDSGLTFFIIWAVFSQSRAGHDSLHYFFL